MSLSLNHHDEDLRLEILARFQLERREHDLMDFLKGLRDDFFKRLAAKRRKADMEFLEEFQIWLSWKEKLAHAHAEHDRETLFLLLLWLFFLILKEKSLCKAIEKARLEDKDRFHFFERHETLTHLIECAAFASGCDFHKIHQALTSARLPSASGEFHPLSATPYPRIAAWAGQVEEEKTQSGNDLAESFSDPKNRPNQQGAGS